MRAVLGLDLSKNTGVAFAPPQGPWSWWRIELNPRGALEGVHFFNFHKQLNEALRTWKPQLVVFEEVDFIRDNKQRLAFRINAILCGIVMVSCESFAVPYVGVPVTTLKKFAGHGNASKDMMRDFAARKLFGSAICEPMPVEISSDEIDALWLVQYGRTQVRYGRRSA